MDQSTRSTGTYLVAAIHFMISFLFLIIGVALLFSYPEKWSLFGLLFLACFAGMVHGGIQNLRLGKAIEREAVETIRLIQQQRSAQPVKLADRSIDKLADEAPVNSVPSEAAVTILASWVLTADEWALFMKRERTRRKTDTTIEAGFIVILGTPFVYFVRDTGWVIALAVSTIVATIYWLGKYFMSLGSVSVAKNQSAEVVVTSRSVTVNGKVNSFRDSQYYLRAVRLVTDETAAQLEFEYGWATRSASSYEVIRVPIPATAMDDAKAVLKYFQDTITA